MGKHVNSLYFGQKEIPPEERMLHKVLGQLHPAYKEVLELTEGYSYEWKYYGKTLGWQLKVTHKGKALLYLTPLENSFRIGFAVRENEKEALLKSDLPPKTREQLAIARKYPEGYPLQLEIKTKTDMKAVRIALGVLKQLRS